MSNPVTVQSTIDVGGNTTQAANAKGFEMHPAAAIFRTVLLNEISEENGSLMKDVERLQPLLNHLQKVEVIAHAVDEERHPGQLTLVKQTISGLKLSDGEIVSTSSGKNITFIPKFEHL